VGKEAILPRIAGVKTPTNNKKEGLIIISIKVAILSFFM